MERSRPLATEKETAIGHSRAAHSKLLAPLREQLAVFARDAFRRDLRLAVTPALVAAAVRAIVRVPHGHRARIKTHNEFLGDSGFTAILRIHRLMERRKLLHRNSVEAQPSSGRCDSAREGSKELMLPAQVLLLFMPVADAERDVLRGDASERAIAQEAAGDELLLVGRQGVMVD